MKLKTVYKISDFITEDMLQGSSFRKTGSFCCLPSRKDKFINNLSKIFTRKYSHIRSSAYTARFYRLD